MASYSDVASVHKTLTGTTVDSVNLTKKWRSITVTNYDPTNRVYVAFGMAAAPADPSAAANGTYVIPPNSAKTFRSRANSPNFVKVLGNGGAYSVEGF